VAFQGRARRRLEGWVAIQVRARRREEEHGSAAAR
jgi:hypothetical protein